MVYKLARVSEIPEGKGIVVKVSSELEVALFKKSGKVFAINNICPLSTQELRGTEFNSSE